MEFAAGADVQRGAKFTAWESLTGVFQVAKSETIRVVTRGPKAGHGEVCWTSHDTAGESQGRAIDRGSK